MKTYETMCVLAPDLGDEKIKAIEEKIKKIFATHKVKELSKKDWGKRPLAYAIKRHKTGHYLQLTYDSPAIAVNDLEKNLGYEENVLRYLTITREQKTAEKVQLEPGGFESPSY